ncbi:hypothetical protein RIF29_30074 [Crotalaria pallida]|uniref:Uncharacterized protein n=1 Tax=Crotalaria pallida TaxID=3830 RepID=A0AAN9EKU4_CROPI
MLEFRVSDGSLRIATATGIAIHTNDSLKRNDIDRGAVRERGCDNDGGFHDPASLSSNTSKYASSCNGSHPRRHLHVIKSEKAVGMAAILILLGYDTAC